MLLVPYAAPVLLKTQQDTFDMIERERQQCHQDAKAAIAQEREQARAREQRIRLQEREYPATVRRGSSAVAAPMEPKPTNDSGQQKTIVPVESDATIYEKWNTDAKVLDLLVEIVRADGYKCDSISIATPFIFSGVGAHLFCNKGRYHYEIEDKGGHPFVKVD